MALAWLPFLTASTAGGTKMPSRPHSIVSSQGSFTKNFWKFSWGGGRLTIPQEWVRITTAPFDLIPQRVPGIERLPSGSLPHMGQRPRKETKLQALLKSPWTWVGVGGAVTLVLLLLLVFLLTSPSPERTAEAPEPSQRSVELLLMLAGLTEIDLGTSRQSVNPNLVRFYPAVGSAAFAAAHQLGLRVTDKAPAVLAVDMQADETSASPNVRLLLRANVHAARRKTLHLVEGGQTDPGGGFVVDQLSEREPVQGESGQEYGCAVQGARQRRAAGPR